jgi:hypothetical protein
VLGIPRDDRQIVRQPGRANPEIVGLDHQAIGLEKAENLRVFPIDLYCPRKDAERSDEIPPFFLIGERLPSRQFSGHSVSNEQTVIRAPLQELCSGACPTEPFPLEVDQKRGLENQRSFHLSTGGRSPALASSTAANSSSEKNGGSFFQRSNNSLAVTVSSSQ